MLVQCFLHLLLPQFIPSYWSQLQQGSMEELNQGGCFLGRRERVKEIGLNLRWSQKSQGLMWRGGWWACPRGFRIRCQWTSRSNLLLYTASHHSLGGLRVRTMSATILMGQVERQCMHTCIYMYIHIHIDTYIDR